VPSDPTALIPALENIATQLRILSVLSTSQAGSGHPSTCLSAAEIMAVLFFSEMRFDPKDPQRDDNDRFVMSKGHAAPILYAAWAEAGLFDRAEVLKLREIGSDLEGHPTPRLSFVDVATGSLGQGICAAIGTALNARRIASDYRTYVLLGDGENAEGSVWEAAQAAALYHLDNLCTIVDVNAFGQSRPTMFQHDMSAFARRWSAFGWHTIVVDGHDVEALRTAFDEARGTRGQPAVILARTVKGKGVSIMEGKDGWHGKALKKGEETERAVKELESQFKPIDGTSAPGDSARLIDIRRPLSQPPARPAVGRPDPPSYGASDSVATREAFGTALAKLAKVDARVVALDADVANSTFSERVEKDRQDHFYECYIAEQVMVGAAMGLAARGAIPFPSTFACFLTRAYDFIRMAAISNVNIKLGGSHAGISIGEDGPSQMALEDLAMMRAEPNFTVLYPSDAVCTERLVALMAATKGPSYIRLGRPKAPILYSADDTFEIGGSKTLRQSADDVATVVGAGVTLLEALKAHDELKKDGVAITVIDLYSVQPIDARALVSAARRTGNRIITVEDHYAAGGLGDAVAQAVAGEGITVERLAVREIPRSGKPEELLDRFGISARHIVKAVRAQSPVRQPASR
jgi:transketolase